MVAVFSVVKSYQFAQRQREKIYVLDQGKSLMLALSQDLSQNRPVEAREDVYKRQCTTSVSPRASAPPTKSRRCRISSQRHKQKRPKARTAMLR